MRNKFFDWGLFKSISFSFPIISVGNLSAGGTGKTPHVEYIIRLLIDNYNIATLSRGYKRNTSGFVLADEQSTAISIGDEPFQFNSKFKSVTVAVDEKRVRGVQKLKEKIQNLDLVILDDAFQHRNIRPGFSVLLTDFYNLYSHDYLLPVGRLREYRKGADRADLIVVTKSPRTLSPLTRRRVLDSLHPLESQQVCFSYIEHQNFAAVPGLNFKPGDSNNYSSILLVAGIANPYPLEVHLSDQCAKLEKLYFPDHHKFTDIDIQKIISTFEGINTPEKVIVTTEKDMVRLLEDEILDQIKHLPICYVPIAIKFHSEDQKNFENKLLEYVKNH